MTANDIIERNAKCARDLLDAGAEIERLRAAAKPFAELARGFDYFSASDKLNLAAGLTVADLRKLRDAYDGVNN